MDKIDKWWMNTSPVLKLLIIMGTFMLFTYATIKLDMVPQAFPEIEQSHHK